ncbi:MAG: formate dehydrogenase accessory sulfurtransferase FdhD [Candidatus Dormibacteraeota bacterium]|nr:formate dehydrogenase accessory sulfurtransferase FdhD [Candidatus Dormibacteraeota bacterium]
MAREAFRPQAPPVPVHRLRRGAWAAADDQVAAEEPLQILLDSAPLSVVMRTPGNDVELAVGLLWSERVLSSLDAVDHILVSAEAGEQGSRVRPELLESNTVDVVRRDPSAPAPARRAFVTSSACGVCGTVTVDELAAGWPAIPRGPHLSWDLLGNLPDRLRDVQGVYHRTGGEHGAALFDATGELLLAREDVGRHNAVDKIVGRLFLDRSLPATGRVLAVSGRAGFEIVQKAVAAGVCAVVAVGAPSSLAVATARRFGLTLVGFAARDRGNVYAGDYRVLELGA